MKKITLSVLAIAICFLAANAQNGDITKKKNRHHKREMPMQQLNLTKEQKDQVKTNNDAFRKKMDELNKKDNITVKQYREQKNALQKEKKSSFEKILTAEQKEALENNKKDRKGNKQKMSANRMGKMKTKLNLSDKQVADIKADKETNKAAIKSIKENNKLSSTEKEQKINDLRKQNRENFKKHLTPEQLSKMGKKRNKVTGKTPSI